ncbi:hypothetical protein BJ322DRAFT_1019211 [Thelephora terrestris]|uniref:Uncharacterized protein n=1 Tax=Thelephora terrestris TaxID=56493 RepID=A0A9P6HLQ5_9AGAM|nr:hypothetical protein BJ322DRAFT_1019211 [Thelephora terrestris]
MDTLGFDGALPERHGYCQYDRRIARRLIPDPKMSEILTSRNESGAFRKLCGDSARCQHPMDHEVGNEREVKSKNLFEAIFGRGSRIGRPESTAPSGESLIRLITCNLPRSLQIQNELGDECKGIPATAAGVELVRVLNAQIEVPTGNGDDAEQAVKNKDEELAKGLDVGIQ